jgi:predicted enzyme related to lactoylglutathione lyase
MANRVSHFEILADDPERAIAFYTSVFGWDFKKWEGGQYEYWMVMTGKDEEVGGINGGMIRRAGPVAAEGMSANGFVCTMVVDAYDVIAEKIIAAGGQVVMAKYPLIGMAWQGYFKDTEGNVIGVHQPDVHAGK